MGAALMNGAVVRLSHRGLHSWLFLAQAQIFSIPVPAVCGWRTLTGCSWSLNSLQRVFLQQV